MTRLEQDVRFLLLALFFGTVTGCIIVTSEPTETLAETDIPFAVLPEPDLGVTVENVDDQTAAAFGLKAKQGVLITDIDPAGPAYETDLRRGMVIVEVNLAPVRDVQDFMEAVEMIPKGDRATLRVKVDGLGEFLTAAKPVWKTRPVPRTRRVPRTRPEPIPPTLGAAAQRWAVLIGISEYEHTSSAFPNLKYAHRDAERFADFLKSPAGGSFQGDHVKLLTNEAATKEAITSALFDFLKHTVREDLVVIYFSGHGLPDPDKPSNTYLMARDSDPAKIASTGFPMWDLATALTRTISAERVVVLADACHSAAATEGVKGVRVAGRFSSYFDELAKSGPGRVMFTSCRDDEVSRENEKWDGGHGVFTWALLKGLEGQADADRDGVVRLGELLDYVDITVRRETANEQNPVKSGTRFDPKLPMGILR